MKCWEIDSHRLALINLNTLYYSYSSLSHSKTLIYECFKYIYFTTIIYERKTTRRIQETVSNIKNIYIYITTNQFAERAGIIFPQWNAFNWAGYDSQYHLIKSKRIKNILVSINARIYTAR